jgi:endonuclease YncB( thermonuclease family)
MRKRRRRAFETRAGSAIVLLAFGHTAGALAGEPSNNPLVPTAATQAQLIRLPRIPAAGLIENGKGSFRLEGVLVTAFDTQCGAGVDQWPCGRLAKTAVQRLIRGRTIECQLPQAGSNSAEAAECRVGGKNIGEWLVSQGWAKADGPRYAEAEKKAAEGKLGLWSPTRPGPALDPAFVVGTTMTDAPVRVEVSVGRQSMTLIHLGRIVGEWPVSTARDGKETPTGIWTAKWLSRDHHSKLYDNAPMPYSVFYDGDYAIHGTYQTGRLGRPASHGCVRLETRHAATLFRLVEKEGVGKTLVVIRP